VKRVLVGLILAGLAVASSACSSSGSSGDERAAGAAGSKASAGPETPQFIDDFARTCADGLGFAGLPAYTKSRGSVHPAVVLRKDEDRWYQTSASPGDYPRGWLIEDFKAAKQAQLAVCVERTKAFPAGKQCRMEKDKKPLLVTMYNTEYRLRVLDARTGKPLLNHVGKAVSTTCPILTYVSDGEDPTKYYTDPDHEDYRPLLKRFIAP
jgi:hypothetical protein